MNNRKRLHPVYVLFTLLQWLKGLLPIIIITILRGAQWKNLGWYPYAGAGAFAAILIAFGYLSWRKFTYVLEEDRIVLRKGVLFRDEKTIFFSRIHSVNIEQPLVQRLLGVAQLKIETPGGDKNADGILAALSNREAEQLRSQLLNRSKPGVAAEAPMNDTEAAGGLGLEQQQTNDSDTVAAAGSTVTENAGTMAAQPMSGFKLSSGQLLKAAITSTNFGLVIAFIAGVISFADDVLKLFLPDHFFERLYSESTSLLTGSILFIALAGFGAIFLAWLLSVILYIVKFSGFEVRREGNRVSVGYGLLDKKTLVFDPDKVQAVIVNESPLRQWIGHAQIQLQVVSSNKNEQLVLHPFIKLDQLQPLLDEFVPHMKANQVRAGAPKRSRIYFYRIPLVIVAGLSFAAIGWFKVIGLWSLLLLPLTALWCGASYRASGIALEEGQLTLRHRSLSRLTFFIRRPQIVTMKVNRTFSQRRKRIVSVSVTAMGGQQPFEAPYLDQADVEPVWAWFSRSGGNSQSIIKE
ncbi:PH domain-containing protein [Paenibacillus sp. NPDC058071]|uniref:PH domain-containing protein n=1 Tax=Paenibacillus sp. NPDC058071 TaxID=3346326 RepID=UPI0036DDBC1A